ncbi:MAG TPA: DUF5916 domain-containing protein [Kofleriaceae bacterium]|nr:DUF5916 domain-containing protein [Kofleriaceae bacterium]
MFALVLAAAASLAPTRVAHAPHIDGHLDDTTWSSIAASEAFTQTFPDDGQTPREATRVRVAYDDANLYVAIDCDQRVPIVARLTRRDREIDGDRVSIDLDTSAEKRGAFHFQVSAAGVMVDALRYDDTELATEWDEVWQAEVAPTPTGWSAELAIPLRILRIKNGVPTWGFQVRRWVGATGEEDEWAYSPRDSGGEVSRYGELGPFVGLAPHMSIALVPFALSRFVATDAEARSAYGDGLSAAGGLDLTWRPAPSVAVSTAVLPDFGQVEADQVVINLTTTETEYPEKRPFFLQGMDLFQTPIQLLYTRRIGEPAESPALPANVTQLEPVGAAPVLGAAKLVATKGGIEIGALSALTGRVDATTDAGGVPAALGASHHVLRAKGTHGPTTFGLLGTAQLQQEASERYPLDAMTGDTVCLGGALVMRGARCGHDAYTGAIDGAWRTDDSAWVVGGQVAGSQRAGGPSVQLPDGTIVRDGDGGVGSTVHVAREGGTLRGELLYEGYSRRFMIDDLGYNARSNMHHVSLDLEAYTAHAHGPMLESRSRLELFWRRNLDGLVLPSGYQWNVSGTFKGMWEAFLEVHWRPHYFDDREFGDGRALERAGRLGLELSVHSDPRRAVTAGASLSEYGAGIGNYTEVDSNVTIRPRDDIELELEPSMLVTRGEPRYLEDDTIGPRFARQDATSFGVTTRAIWTLERDLSVQAYVQALLATIRYRDAFGASPDDRVIRMDDLVPGTFDPAMYDGREGALNATVVGRWEYRPGSTAFLVYSHAQSPLGDRATYDPGALVRGPKQDVVLLKLSWAWLR